MINFLYNCDDFVKNDQIVGIIRLVYNAIKIGVPIILIVVGMFDMGKAITQQKEDEIKKAQSLLVKKAIAAALVFLMFAIVQLLISVVTRNSTEKNSVVNCINSILNEQSDSKTNEEKGSNTETNEEKGSN